MKHLNSPLFKPFYAIAISLISCSFAQEQITLFDGKTLNGWSIKSEDKQFWSVKDGAIVAHNNGKNIPRSSYLYTEKQYQNFEFRCKFRLTGDEKTGVINSGIQFRTQNKNWKPVGYQADIGGPTWWGGIYEEGGRRQLASADMDKVLPVIKNNDWNDYRIRVNGPVIELFINGQETVDYLELVPSTPRKGHFALQLHKGGAAQVEFKDITLTKLDGGLDPSNRAQWAAEKNYITYLELQISNTPQTPAEELQGFTVPEGFQVELVAQESKGIGKFIGIDFDNQGRMWSMTGLEYPFDAKKQKQKQQAKVLFNGGGKDKVLVFDTPSAKGAQKPHIFAEKLAIPLGVMPYKNGAIAQNGPDIRFYQDTDGDGTADKYDVLLTGFGIEDSHLFPHQFTRGPGDWMYLAQGLGNFSKVVRPDGSDFAHGKNMVPYERCRVSRMKLDGSDFQNTTTGPNNVWGIVAGRDGEWFIQEANDKGYPVAPYDFGVYLKTGGTTLLKPYQPILPPIFDTAIMGGTGLSGLVLSEDFNSAFSKEGKKTFYLANPLTSSIQVVTATPLGNNRFKWQKEEPLLTSEDRWFRPVAIKFGPDGALYVVDWYNKIIAHGEVAQNHPERDKVRGRIWRITPKGHQHTPAPNLAKASDAELLKFITDNNALVQRLTWLEMIDRQATSLIPQLQANVRNTTQRLDIRLASLWACEGLAGTDAEFLKPLVNDKEANLRAEIVRIAGRVATTPVFAEIAKTAAKDTAVRVRNATGEALVSRLEHNADTMHAAALLAQEELSTGHRLNIYERQFERFLARWAMENNPKETTAMLGQAADLPVENRLLAMQSLNPADAALAFLPMVSKLDRDLSTTELSLITSQLSQKKVMEGFKKLLFDSTRQKSMLTALSKADPEGSNPLLNKLLVEACNQLIVRENTLENQLMVVKTTQCHLLTELSGTITNWMSSSSQTELLTSGFKCLRELDSVDAKLSKQFSTHADTSVQREAIIALSTTKEADTLSALLEHWDKLTATDQQSAFNGLMNSEEKAKALSKEILKGSFGEVDSGTVESIVLTLGNTEETKQLLKKLGGSIPMVIRMTGAKEDHVDTNIKLTGSFTLEAWVKITGKKASSGTLLAGSDGAKISFNKGTLQVSGSAKARNLVSATSPAIANLWTHYAVVREKNGSLDIYIDGVLNATSKKSFKGDLTDLDIGTASGGQIEFLELRVWNLAKSKRAILDGMLVSYAEGKHPDSLVSRFSADQDDLALKGKSLIAPASDAPSLITTVKAKELAKSFRKYTALAAQPGDKEKGKLLFANTCQACHMVNNVGGALGPDLSGIGTSTDEGLLRNILTPSAALESSYYKHNIKMKNGSLITGAMIKESDKTLTIRPLGGDDKIIPKDRIQSHTISKNSLMPEGLLNSMSDQGVADIFSYMRTLKGK